jgi:Domain of unknown function (DUF4265)
MKSEPEMRKIRIALPEDAWHGVEAEWAWGKQIEDSIYALRNVPFYAMGLSYDDRVKVNDVDGTLCLLGVVLRGGHSTYRIFAKKGHENPRVRVLLNELNELHCDIEVGTEGLIAVDVLPEADIHKVYVALQKAEEAKIIDFHEGHCGHHLTSKPQ